MHELSDLLSRYDLEPEHAYLLELMPLIEMVWADGKNQEAEIAILQRFAVKHLANLSSMAAGEEVVSTEVANDFIERFIKHRPPAGMLKELRQFALERLKGKSHNERLDVMEACLDIAAACAPEYPYAFGERIIREEKKLLREIMDALMR